jgi:hypothetical protein
VRGSSCDEREKTKYNNTVFEKGFRLGGLKGCAMWGWSFSWVGESTGRRERIRWRRESLLRRPHKEEMENGGEKESDGGRRK